jgi:hypothetical protein
LKINLEPVDRDDTAAGDLEALRWILASNSWMQTQPLRHRHPASADPLF